MKIEVTVSRRVTLIMIIIISDKKLLLLDLLRLTAIEDNNALIIFNDDR